MLKDCLSRSWIVYKLTLEKLIRECMFTTGQLSIADFSKSLDLPSEFLHTLVKELIPKVMDDYIVGQDERTYYTADMMDRITSSREMALEVEADKTISLRQTNVLDVLRLSQVRKMSHSRSEIKKFNTTLNVVDPKKAGTCVSLGKDESEPMSERDNSYLRAIEDLNSLQSNTQTLALAKYKNPQEILPLFTKQLASAGIELDSLDKLKIVHVSGTKGKGSTCAFVESILRTKGLKTGFYNSPHLVKVTERIRIDGQPLEDEKFSRYFRRIYDNLLEATVRGTISMPSYFSFLTILAFHAFLEEKVDCAIIEVGIGGEYDPTNIVKRPKVCGITTIHFDHTNILGDTIESIAWSKAGIIKRGAPVFTVPQRYGKALEVIQSRPDERGSHLHLCKPLESAQIPMLGINGSAQYLNASLAMHLAYYVLEDSLPSFCSDNTSKMVSDARTGFLDCRWPGRCQVLKYPRFTFFLDGAHTNESMTNCTDWFQSLSVGTDSYQVLFVNIIGDRSKKEILQPLCDLDTFDLVIFSNNKVNADVKNSGSETFKKVNGEKGNGNVDDMASCWDELTKARGGDSRAHLRCRSVTDGLIWLKESASSNSDKKYHILVTDYVSSIPAPSGFCASTGPASMLKMDDWAEKAWTDIFIDEMQEDKLSSNSSGNEINAIKSSLLTDCTTRLNVKSVSHLIG